MTFNKNAILGVVAALFIGGLGNGIWEYVLEPAFAWSATGILNIATLGIQSFKDDIYSEIAKGFHEESSLSLANTFYYLLGYGVAFGFFLLTRKIKDMLSKISSVNKELGDIEAAVNGNTDVDKSKNDIRMHISKLREQNSRLAPKAKLLHKAARASALG